MNKGGQFFIGLMSGTSLDGVDGVVLEFVDRSSEGFASHSALHPTCRIRSHCYLPFSPQLRDELALLQSSGVDELHRSALASNALSRSYAQVVERLLQQTGLSAENITAIGAHGQTIRHCPLAFDGVGYTLQIQNPSLLAELSGIAVVADFRSRDLAAGGQGAPLVPAFHAAVFAGKRTAQSSGTYTAVLNLGGIANLSLIEQGNSAENALEISGFDCGPANVLMDAWIQQHLGKSFDCDGVWASTGVSNEALIRGFLSDAYFHTLPPKSTGRDRFNITWLKDKLRPYPELLPEDVQASLLALTVRSIAQDLQRETIHWPDASTLWVCGGGAFNSAILKALQLALPRWQVQSTEILGIHPMQVEAAAFAWFARQTWLGLPSNCPAVTGAKSKRVLGAIYPA